MEGLKFRHLNADELEARVSTVSDKGCSILIYKNARVDMKVLDETVGAMNWQRDHKEIKGNMYAGVGIWDSDKAQWVWKWDCGTENYTEKEKSEASDSFKRAGFNWGIGRALYTCPFIWFKANQVNLADRGGKPTTYDTFHVDAIEYNGDACSYIRVSNNKTGATFTWGNSKEGNLNANRLGKDQIFMLNELIKQKGTDVSMLLSYYGVDSIEDMTMEQYRDACFKLSGKANRGKA